MIVLTIFGLVLLVQLYFYLFIFRHYAFRGVDNSFKSDPSGVSVVVCARNEADNLLGLLQDLTEQEHPNYELLLVNDASTDSTGTILNEFATSNRGANFTVRVIHIPPAESNGKKHALEQGIRQAQYDKILLTDADCRTRSRSWIETMSSPLSGKTQIVLGYGAYEKRQGSYLNKLIRFETILTALQYFSYALNGKPYMGVGRNLCYSKSLFLKAKGFATHSHIRSGDDDLFVSQMAHSENTRINDLPQSMTRSLPSRDFKSWFKQKRRHITTAGEYTLWHQYHLGFFFLSQISFYAILFYGLVLSKFPILFAFIALIRFLVWYPIMVRTCNKLEEKDLITFGPLYEFSLILVQLSIFFKNLVSPPKHW